MANPSDSTVQNLLPVQAYFDAQGNFQTFIGQNQPFYATPDPEQSGLHITNSTIDSSVIGGTTPAAGNFSTATVATQPSAATDVVNLLALQSYAAGISWKQPCVVATLANITLSGLQEIDGHTVVAGDRVLVKNQGTAANNGIYLASASTWTRALDADTWDELICAISFIEYGTQAGGAWFCTAQAGGTLGVTAVNWSQFTTSATYSAGTGLTLTGTVFSITPVGTASTYGSASTVPVFTTNASGQVSSVTNTNIAIGATQITSGTIDSARISGVYSGITGVGTLVDLTVTNTISGSINGNAATATTAGSATTATTATNIAGGASGSIPYQTASGTTSLLAKGTDGQILALASGLPSWIDNQTGTVTSVSGTGTVSGISLSGTVTSSGSLTLGGTLDLSSPPAIGGTTPNTAKFTTELVGANANFTDFPNAVLIGSQANTGSAHIYNIGVAGEGVATDVVGAGQWGVGVYGTGATAGATRGIGVVGDGHVGNTADTAAAIGVRGYATGTHAGGQNIGLYSQATGGASNYSLFMASGNIYSAVTQTWQIPDNETASLSIFSSGKAGILNIVTTDGAEGISTSGNLNVAGTVALNGSTGTSGYVMTSNGASAPTWSALPASGITVTDDTTTNATRYITFTSATSGSITGENVSSTKLQYNPSTGLLSSTGFSGSGASLTALSASNVSAGTLAVAYGGTGSNTLTANNVLLGNGTSALQAVAPSTSGNVLTSNGTTWVSSAPPSGGQYYGSAAVKAIAYNSNSIAEDITILANTNGLSAGPVTIATGYTVTVATDAVWVVV